MAIRNIVTNESDVEFLRKKSKPVVDFDEKLWQLLDDMKETMHQNNGVGIAAVQVGVLKRVVIVEPNNMFLDSSIHKLFSKTGKKLTKKDV